MRRTRPRARRLATKSLRLVKGSHIVRRVSSSTTTPTSSRTPDKRIIFAILYQDDFLTLIGTTDVEVQGEPGTARIEGEIAYLCEQASRYFAKPIVPADVVWTYSGVRLAAGRRLGDPSAVTRDYLLEKHTDGAPLLTVWGGKITTFRKLAEDAADDIGQMLGERRPA